ncbi:MAG: EpsG family protein [Muribaculaceae bacterium]|nr:EpsG family protein [Muribaculaceae bacterium]
MFPWIIFITVITLILGYWKLGKNNLKIRFILGSIIAIIFSIIRYDVGYDYFQYYNKILNNTYDYELISSKIAFLGYYFRYPPLAISLFGLISYILIFNTIYKFSINPIFSLFIFICLLYLPFLTTIRQALAVSISFYSFRFILKKQLLYTIIFTIIAIFVHSSAIFTLFIYIIYNYIKPKYTIYILLGAVILYPLIFIAFAEIGFYARIASKFQDADITELGDGGGGNKIKWFYFILCVITIITVRIKKIKINNNLLSILIFGCIFPFLLGAHYGQRVGQYFNIYYLFVIPIIIKPFNKLIKFSTTFIFSLYFIILLNSGSSQYRKPYVPYKTLYELYDVNNPKFRN